MRLTQLQAFKVAEFVRGRDNTKSILLEYSVVSTD